MIFFCGAHHPGRHPQHLERSFISVNRLLGRKGPFKVGDWVMDSGAFTTVKKHGDHTLTVKQYANEGMRWAYCGNLLAVVSQDYMCEDFILRRVKRTVKQHQDMTVSRYVDLLACMSGTYVMPVLQGYFLEEYLECLDLYGNLLPPGAWVGVGSVCKRNANVASVRPILKAIHDARPDLRLHGFGLKSTALQDKLICDELYSSDSMAWSYEARHEKLAAKREGRPPRVPGSDANGIAEAVNYAKKIDLIIASHQKQTKQTSLFQ